MKKNLCFLFAGLLLFSLSSCNCDDVNWWKPDELAPQLQGFVHSIDQKPIYGATVNLNVGGTVVSVKTDIDGHYVIESPAGEGIAEAVPDSRSSLVGNSKIVKLENNKITECNFLLLPSSSNVGHVKTDEGDIYSIGLPNVVPGYDYDNQYVSTSFPSGSLKLGEKIRMTASYGVVPSVAVSKAGDVPMIDSEGYRYTGMDVVIFVETSSTTGAKEMDEEFTVIIQQIATPSSVKHNSIDVETYTAPSGEEVFNTNQLGETVINYPIYSKVSDNRQEEIYMTPSEFKSQGETTEIISYYRSKYGIFTDFESQKPSLLWNYVTVLLGSYWSEEVDRTYTATMEIPAGESVVLHAYQSYQNMEYKCGKETITVKNYNGINISAIDRLHTGGSN